jgi:DNA replication terminus site-binding protein
MQTIKIDLDQTMSSIVTTKDLMMEIFREGKIVQCEGYELPLVTREQENERPDYIRVKTHKDNDNALSLMREINRWYAREDTFDIGLSTKASQRVPGFIQVQMNNELYAEFDAVTTHLNDLKEQFRAHVISIKKPDLRFEILHQMFSMLITMNLYRKVKVYRNPKDVGFFWANKQRIETVNFKKLKERLERSRDCPTNLSVDREVWRDKVENEIELLASVNDKSALRTVRDTKVQPMVNVDGQQTSCPIPIILASKSSEPVKVESLEDYHASKQRKGTGRKAKEYVQLISRLSLYEAISI